MPEGSIWSRIKGTVKRMINAFFESDIKRVLGVDAATDSAAQQLVELWAAMYRDEPPWKNRTTKTLGLPAAIAGEVARLTVVEFDSGVSGSARAEYINEHYTRFIRRKLDSAVELAAAGGGVMLKPYVTGGGIVVDVVPAWRFIPTSISGTGEITGAVFLEQARRGRRWYTRAEMHELEADGYTIRNRAFVSDNEGTIGTECALTAVDEWAELEAETTIQTRDGSGIQTPLFAYFRMPQTCNAALDSPIGAAAYSRAAELIEEADKQYSRILWEYEGSELAIDASEEAIRPIRKPNGETVWSMPERSRRLFRALSIEGADGGDLYKVFSPQIRDESLFNGLDKLLKRIEFSCGLAYGTLSDPQSVDKTAEEIRAGKQRSYSAICRVQQALETALEQLIAAMDVYASLYKLAPSGKYETLFSWGDGILQDADKDFASIMAMANQGYLDPVEVVKWYFGCTEEDARARMPQAAPEITFEGF